MSWQSLQAPGWQEGQAGRRLRPSHTNGLHCEGVGVGSAPSVFLQAPKHSSWHTLLLQPHLWKVERTWSLGNPLKGGPAPASPHHPAGLAGPSPLGSRSISSSSSSSPSSISSGLACCASSASSSRDASLLGRVVVTLFSGSGHCSGLPRNLPPEEELACSHPPSPHPHLTNRILLWARGGWSCSASAASCSARCSSSFMSSMPLCPGARSDTGKVGRGVRHGGGLSPQPHHVLKDPHLAPRLQLSRSSQFQAGRYRVEPAAPSSRRSRLGRGQRQDPQALRQGSVLPQGGPNQGEGWLQLLTSACSTARHLEHLRGHEVDLCVVSGLHTSADTQHLPDGVLVAMPYLEVLPCLPEGPSCLWRVGVPV